MSNTRSQVHCKKSNLRNFFLFSNTRGQITKPANVTDDFKLEHKPYTVKIIRAKSKMPSHRPLVSRII